MPENPYEPPKEVGTLAQRQTGSKRNSNIFGRSITHHLLVAHDLWAIGTLILVICQLAILPKVERAILLYFVPPLIAWLILVVNRGRINATPISGCRLFLTLIALAVTAGELTFILPNLKP